MFTTYGEGLHDMQVSEADKDKVMHVSLPIGSGVLMGSDNVDCHGHDSPPLVIGNNFALSYSTESKQQSDGLLAKLSEGGSVTMPISRQNYMTSFITRANETGCQRHQRCMAFFELIATMGLLKNDYAT